MKTTASGQLHGTWHNDFYTAGTQADRVIGVRRVVQYWGNTNSRSIGTKRSQYIEEYTCYGCPSDCHMMMVDVKVTMPKVCTSATVYSDY